MEYQFESIGPALTVIVLVFLIAFALIVLGLIVVFAALPGHIARSRQHSQAEAINICGWVGLPTGVLWVLALVWAYYRDPRHTVSNTVGGSEFEGLGQQLAALENAVTSLESSLKGGTR